MPLNLDINPDDFTLGDIEDFESYCGQPFEALLSGQSVATGKVLTALVWVIKRRDNPQFTTEDAKKVKLSEFTADPTSPPAKNGKVPAGAS